MPGLRFDIPVGAAADVKELQYIIALHQTSSATRRNGTVSSQDIKALLKSRYELAISHKQAVHVARSLGGGGHRRPPVSSNDDNMNDADGNPSDSTDKDPTLIAKTAGTAWGAAVAAVTFVTHPFHSPEKTSDDVSGDHNVDDPEHASEAQPENHQPSASNRNSYHEDMEELNRLHIAQQQGEVVDTKSLLLMKEKVTENLKERVLQRNQATRQLNVSDSDDGSETNAGEEARNGGRPHAEPELVDPAEDEDDIDDPDPEYLDLVQILSTIMIPTFARMADEVKRGYEPTERDHKRPGLLRRLLNRFVEYGRRKLALDDPDEPGDFTSSEIFRMARRALLLKAVPTAREDTDMDALVVNESLVQLLLITHGEIERAMDAKLVREMVRIAQSPSGCLDFAAFANALASDLSCWDASSEEIDTTFFDDVFGIPTPLGNANFRTATSTPPKETSPKAKDDIESRGLHDEPSELEKPHLPTEPNEEKLDFNINRGGTDLVLDTQVSFVILVFIWLSYILTTTVYGSQLFQYLDVDKLECALEEFWCIFVETVINWGVAAALLSLLGLLHVHPISFGNSASHRTIRSQMFGALVTLLFTVPPYLAAKSTFRKNDAELDAWYTVTLEFNLVVGCVLVLMFLLQSLFTLIAKVDQARLPGVLKRLASVTSWNSEISVHRAAKYKVDRIVARALQLHQYDHFSDRGYVRRTRASDASPPVDGDQIMRNYVLYGERLRGAGGPVWTWWKILDGSLFNVDGIWLNARLRVIQAAQVMMGTFLTAISLVIVERGAEDADELRKSVEEDELEDWIMDIFPTGSMIRGAFFPAVFVSMIAMAMIASLYIPSATATILKYRHGVLPSLGSPYFEIFRASLDATHMNTANALYGMLGMAFLIDLVVGGIIFLFLWPPTQKGAFLLLAWGLGLGVTIGLKMALTMTCRWIQYRAFYRIRPTAARITSLALECWYLGLAGSVLLARIGQFLFAAVFWIGRIDVPFLSEDVSLLGYSFDYVSIYFFKDLLVHEAHRHPYIERLAQMYLMKLRNGDRFVSEAGSAWRQLIVTATLPWLLKHRVFRDERLKDAMIDLQDDKRMEEEEAKIYVGGVTKGVKDLGEGVGREVVDGGKQVVDAGRDIAKDVGRKGAQSVVTVATMAGVDITGSSPSFSSPPGRKGIAENKSENGDDQ